MDGQMREKLLEKLMDFFSMLPEKGEPVEGEAPEEQAEMSLGDQGEKEPKGIC